MKRKIFSLILAAALVLSLSLPALAEEEEIQVETISVSTVEELLSFGESCGLDRWSQDKKVILRADLDLESRDFLPIATFGGTFDGGGHTIRGLKITRAVTPAGLFGSLQQGAVVKNLHVEGTVAPEGECSATGGIAGENLGRVENCTFSGSVQGKTNTGGIAGSNAGTIQNCSVSGSTAGDNRTGGICGYNEGRVEGCRNEMAVNAESVDPTLNPTKLKLSLTLDLAKISDVDVTNAASDTGGIAGYSSGSIESCVNAGTIGYPHIGYNLGGIAGRNAGFLERCENQGQVYGRKDVGGIVGQLEPHVQEVLSPDYLETLSKQFESLGGMVSSTGGDGAELGGDVQDSIAVITAYQSEAQNAVGALISSASQEQVNEGALNELRGAVQGMVDASGTLRNHIGDGVESLTGDISAIAGQISAISRTFALATEDAKQDIVTDLSDVDVDSITEGRVLHCVNSGKVEGDLNVGGITGAMALESTADPEDDRPGGSLTQRRRYELKAIADDCENVGTVTAKRSYCGGICGRMELGLITGCRGYGSISSENGDYVGGIAGLAGGTVRDCFAKCTLTGQNNIGGIVGSGIASDYQGNSSMVTGCCAMVDIADAKQFAGAISGANAGVFVGNFFVSDTLEGIDRVSYAALAEPVSYEKMQTLWELPRPAQELTLRFVADGQTVKTRTFRYGESFDDSVFPEIPQKEGCYARWNIRDLSNLRFDTVVEANYMPYLTALASENIRPDGRPVLFVQGQFQETDTLTVKPGKTVFQPGSNQKLLEQWSLSIPADGLAEHRIRYLPGQQKVQLYVLKSGSWTRIQPEDMGTYLAFDAAGAEVEIAATGANPMSTRQILLLTAAGALILVVIVLIVKAVKYTRKHMRKKKRWLLLLLVPAALAGAALWLRFPETETAEAVGLYDVMKTYLNQPEQRMVLTVDAQVPDRTLDFTAQVAATRVGEKSLRVITEKGRSLYYCDGLVFVENGDAFRISGAAPDYSGLLPELLELSWGVELESTDDGYTLTASGETAVKMARLLMPAVEELLPEEMQLLVEVKTGSNALTKITVSGAGNLADSEKTPFSLSAAMEVSAPSPVEIPAAVKQSILSDHLQAQEIFSDELVQLIRGWTKLQEQDASAAQIQLKADLGLVTVDETFRGQQWKAADTRIYAVEQSGTTLYYGNGKVCNSEGQEILASKEERMDVSTLPELLYKGFRNAQFKCRQEENATVYTVVLQPAGMKELTEALLPQAKKMEIAYQQGTIQLTMENGELREIQVSCTGSVQAAVRKQPISLTLTVTPLAEQASPLPDAVEKTLLAEK